MCQIKQGRVKYFTFNNLEDRNCMSNFEEGDSKICCRKHKNSEPSNVKPRFKVVKMFFSGNFLNKGSSSKILDDAARKISSKGVVTKEKTKLEYSQSASLVKPIFSRNFFLVSPSVFSLSSFFFFCRLFFYLFF